MVRFYYTHATSKDSIKSKVPEARDYGKHAFINDA